MREEHDKQHAHEDVDHSHGGDGVGGGAGGLLVVLLLEVLLRVRPCDDAYHFGEEDSGETEREDEETEIAEDRLETREAEIGGLEVEAVDAESVTRVEENALRYRMTKAILMISTIKPKEEMNTMTLA